MTIGILPECQEHKTEEGHSYGDKCAFPHAEGSVQQNRKSKKDGETGKGSLAVVRNVTQMGCVSQDVDSLLQSSLRSTLKKAKDPRDPIFDRGILRPLNIP